MDTQTQEKTETGNEAGTKTTQEGTTEARNKVEYLRFPESEIKGPEDQHASAFTQHDPSTGWLWIGIKADEFTFRRAWGYILQHYAMLDQLFTEIEKQREIRRKLLSKPQMKPQGGIKSMIQRLNGTHK